MLTCPSCNDLFMDTAVRCESCGARLLPTVGDRVLALNAGGSLRERFEQEARSFWLEVPPGRSSHLRLVTENEFSDMAYGPNDNHSKKVDA